MSGIQRLLDIMAKLRDPEGGCPWDVEQSFATIAPYTIEEAYEVADAISRDDREGLREELGDLLLQVVFHAQMAREAGWFDFEAVVAVLVDKLVRRHPHVFGDAKVESAEAQSRAWDDFKAAERADSARASALDDIPLVLPALMRAAKLARRVARHPEVGLQPGQDLDAAWAGFRNADADTRSEALGELLFALTNQANSDGIDPEDALRGALARFEARWREREGSS